MSELMIEQENFLSPLTSRLLRLGDNCQILAVRSDNCKIRQLSVGTTVRSDNCKIRQLSVGTAVSGPTVSGNCKCFPGTETTVRSYSFRADKCKILQFPLAIATVPRKALTVSTDIPC